MGRFAVSTDRKHRSPRRPQRRKVARAAVSGTWGWDLKPIVLLTRSGLSIPRRLAGTRPGSSVFGLRAEGQQEMKRQALPGFESKQVRGQGRAYCSNPSRGITPEQGLCLEARLCPQRRMADTVGDSSTRGPRAVVMRGLKDQRALFPPQPVPVHVSVRCEPLRTLTTLLRERRGPGKQGLTMKDKF